MRKKTKKKKKKQKTGNKNKTGPGSLSTWTETWSKNMWLSSEILSALSSFAFWEPLWEVSTMASFSTLSHTCPSQVSNPTPTAPAHKPFSSNSNDVLSFCSYASPRTAWSQNLLQIPQGPIFWRREITWESGSRPLAFRPMIGCRTWARGSSWICFF